MRFLTDKLAAEATITGTDESSNYPASNLSHQFLQVRWQPINDGEQTATLTWDEGQYVNCVFLGYIGPDVTNVDIKVYDSGLLETLTGIDISQGSGAYYFSQTWTGVLKVEIIMTGTDGVLTKPYIGGAECGVYYKPPRQRSNHPEGQDDRSKISTTDWGQVQRVSAPWLESAVYSWAGQVRSVRDEFFAAIKAVGIGGTFWVDFYEGDHSIKAPGYQALESLSESENDGYYYSWSLGTKEAR